MLAIIQARMSSQRLPGKVLREMAGKPMLYWVCERLRQTSLLSDVVVATSEEASDDPLCDYCSTNSIPYYRGSLDNVAIRFLECARREHAKVFVRVNGDSPLIDPLLIDHGVALQISTGCDLASNVVRRSYPKGQSVEVIRTSALEEACERMVDAQDNEHVTRYFYAHPELFKIESFSSGKAMGDVQLSVDTSEDFLAAETILKQKGSFVSWETAATFLFEAGI